MVRAAQIDLAPAEEIEPPAVISLPAKRPRPARRSKAGGVVCPTCMSQAAVEKVSHVVRSGRGKLFWDNGEVAHYETELSELLDAPLRPRDVPLLRAAMGLLTPLLLLGLTFAVLSILRAQDYVSIPEADLSMAQNIALVWFGAVVPGILVLGYLKNRWDLRKKLPLWRVAHRRWTGLYYCSHDDIVFEPSMNAIAAPRDIEALLYLPGTPAPRAHNPRPLLKGLSALGVILVILGGSMAAFSTPDEQEGVLSPIPVQRQPSDVQDVSTPPETRPAAEPVTNRANCDQIRGTDYFSPDERVWYLANCLQQ